MNKIIHGDCLEKLKELEDNSIDSIVTDPPYELGFMGKSWDSTGIANNKDMWAECLRVLKPGGHLLAFSGTRTYHRMASAIEDAGFEVRDMIEWVYGSGFPKSLNIGKAVDKLQGNEREVVGVSEGKGYSSIQEKNIEQDNRPYVDGLPYLKADRTLTKGTSEWEGWGTALKPAHEPICMARKPLAEKTVAENCLKWGTGGINIDESRVEGQKPDCKNIPRASWRRMEGRTDIPESTPQVYDSSQGRFPANLIHDNSEEVRECFPESKGGAFPKIHGSSGFVSPEEKEKRIEMNDSGNASRFFKSIPIEEQDEIQEECTDMEEKLEALGISQIEEKTDISPTIYKSILYQAKASKSERNKGCEELETSEKFTAGNYSQSPTCKDCNLTLNGTNDHSECSGEVYYKEMESKNTKNNHPTVKPIALMEYLIKMVTKPGGIVLDPFAGSGSTLVAAKQNGYDFVGIELTEEYIPIIKARLSLPD